MIQSIVVRFVSKIIGTGKRRVTCYAALALISTLTVSTVGFWYFEREHNLSLFDSLWMSYVTMTTVGYGDLYPSTTAGRILGLVVTMTGGIGVAAYIVTLIATAFIEREAKRVKGLAGVSDTGHILIVNCPNEEKVMTLIQEIRLDSKTENVPIVLISDELKECPQKFLDLKDFHFVSGSPLLRSTLDQANAGKASSAIVLAKDPTNPDSDGLTTQLALSLENMHRQVGREIYTVAEAVSRDAIGPLKAAGVEDIICLETVLPPILVQSLLDPGVAGVISELASNSKGSQYYVGRISFLAGKKYEEVKKHLQQRDELRIIPLAIMRGDESMINPGGDTVLMDGDRLLYIADHRHDMHVVLGNL